MIRNVPLSLALLALVIGCRTVAPLPPVNLSEPGWTLRQGQAVWQSQRDAPEIAGELLLATNPDGRALLQFTKTPLPFVTAQLSGDAWQIEFTPQQRRFAGMGTAPPRLLWVHLAGALGQAPIEHRQNANTSAAADHAHGAPIRQARLRLPEPLHFEWADEHSWKLENRDTGEAISGFLNP